MSKKRFRNSRNYFLVGLILIIAGYFIIKYFENQREQEHIDTLSEYLIENKLVDSTRLKEPFGVLVSANANDTIINNQRFDDYVSLPLALLQSQQYSTPLFPEKSCVLYKGAEYEVFDFLDVNLIESKHIAKLYSIRKGILSKPFWVREDKLAKCVVD